MQSAAVLHVCAAVTEKPNAAIKHSRRKKVRAYVNKLKSIFSIE